MLPSGAVQSTTAEERMIGFDRLFSTALALLVSLVLGACAIHVDERSEQPKAATAASAASAAGNVFTPAPGALGPYSGSVRAGGFVFVSGKIGERGEGFEREVVTALDAVEAELERAGLGLRDVVAATVYLTDLDRYAELNALYGARFAEPYPARVCVEVSRLPGDAQVEIQVTARRP